MAKDKKEKESAINPENQLEGFLRETKDEHYNFEEETVYTVSSGSLTIDSKFRGGFSPGFIRLVGYSGGGKTSEGLEIIRNFLKTVENSRAIYIKSEGRLSKEMVERSGVPFVFGSDTSKWTNGTCYVHETNIYENIINLILTLVQNNPQKIRYAFLLDSLDAVLVRKDKGKIMTEEKNSISGAANTTKNFFRELALPLIKYGHLAIFTSQVSAHIQLDAYAKKDFYDTVATGGNAALHFANVIIEFQPQYKSDLITEKPVSRENPPGENNKILGHWVTVDIKKSDNELRGERIKYPIRHGCKNGRSIWREMEIKDLLLKEGLLIRSGAWVSWEKNTYEYLKKQFKDLDIAEKFQGLASVDEMLDENPGITDYFYQMFCSSMCAEQEYNKK